jgi:hypothetical protein
MSDSRVVTRSRLLVRFLFLALLCATGISSCSTSPTSVQPRPDSAGTVWLCFPGQRNDPCTASLKTTVVSANGSRRIVDYRPAIHPAIDCFYLYPNISHQRTADASLRVDPQEISIAELEASQFSRVCRVFAPMYRESTGLDATTATQAITQESVLRSWNDYLAHYNDGRGVVLIGHSEGSYQIAQLLTAHIDQVPGVRALLVSAIITGANLPVYKVGFGPLKTIGPCQSDTQTGCVVDYNAFAGRPPSDSLFGSFAPSTIDGHTVEEICTNPASLGGGTAKLISMYRTHLSTQHVLGSTTEGIFGTHPPTSSTPWIEYDDLYSAACVESNGSRVLMVSPLDHAPALFPAPTAAWGLHLDDPNLALGNLIALVQAEATAYLKTRPVASP